MVADMRDAGANNDVICLMASDLDTDADDDADGDLIDSASTWQLVNVMIVRSSVVDFRNMKDVGPIPTIVILVKCKM